MGKISCLGILVIVGVIALGAINLVSPKNVWYPQDPEAFCQGWLQHLVDRNHIAEMGGPIVVLATLNGIANGSHDATIRANGSEWVVSTAISGKVSMMILKDVNPTWYQATQQAINNRWADLAKVGSLKLLQKLLSTCHRVWTPILVPVPVPAPAPAPVEAPELPELPPTPIIILGVFLLAVLVLAGGARLVAA